MGQVNALGSDAVVENREVVAVVERLRPRQVTVATYAGLDGQCMCRMYVLQTGRTRHNP
jgi:hypothetical protein